jgi:hypothetical protein
MAGFNYPDSVEVLAGLLRAGRSLSGGLKIGKNTRVAMTIRCVYSREAFELRLAGSNINMDAHALGSQSDVRLRNMGSWSSRRSGDGQGGC